MRVKARLRGKLAIESRNGGGMLLVFEKRRIVKNVEEKKALTTVIGIRGGGARV